MRRNSTDPIESYALTALASEFGMTVSELADHLGLDEGASTVYMPHSQLEALRKYYANL